MTDMHQRKAEMAKHADAFIALPGKIHPKRYTSTFFFFHINMLFCVFVHLRLPITLGGYGTMEELLEMISWSQLGIHDKPVR